MNIGKLNLPLKVNDEIGEIISNYQINTNLRLAHFLAQTHYESAGFILSIENLKYTEKRLLQVFPKYFKNITDAKKYANKPELIASYVYSNRMGNSDELSQDGWKYRGRGFMMLTGKNQYLEFSKYVDDDIINNPDLVSNKYALLSAAWYWKKRQLNEIADIGAGSNIVKKITKIINGGLNGLEGRTKLFIYYFNLLQNEK